MFRQPVVRQGVVRVDEIHNWFVVLEHFCKESHRFFLHGLHQKRIDFSIGLGIEL